MKIDTTTNIRLIEGVRATKQSSRAGGSLGGTSAGATVSISSEAQWLRELQGAAGEMPDVRVDEVAQAKADIVSGALDSEVEIEAAIDGLLAGF
jgi:cyanophycinase-like exopeptidase